jgi:hypothetical protein
MAIINPGRGEFAQALKAEGRKGDCYGYQGRFVYNQEIAPPHRKDLADVPVDSAGIKILHRC